MCRKNTSFEILVAVIPKEGLADWAPRILLWYDTQFENIIKPVSLFIVGFIPKGLVGHRLVILINFGITMTKILKVAFLQHTPHLQTYTSQTITKQGNKVRFMALIWHLLSITYELASNCLQLGGILSYLWPERWQK